METINLYAAWAGILAGFVSGAIPGLFFHRDDWLGGYPSWQRRMIRLGHISFFGIAFINLAFVFMVGYSEIRQSIGITSWLYIAAAISMPSVCYLSAIKKYFRHLFFIPVSCLIIGTVIFFYSGVFK